MKFSILKMVGDCWWFPK